MHTGMYQGGPGYANGPTIDGVKLGTLTAGYHDTNSIYVASTTIISCPFINSVKLGQAVSNVIHKALLYSYEPLTVS